MSRHSKLLSLIVSAIVVAALDWATAKVIQWQTQVPLVTPVGIFQQEKLTIRERRGRLSNIRYDSNITQNDN